MHLLKDVMMRRKSYFSQNLSVMGMQVRYSHQSHFTGKAKERKNPDTNPQMWAKLSIQGSKPKEKKKMEMASSLMMEILSQPASFSMSRSTVIWKNTDTRQDVASYRPLVPMQQGRPVMVQSMWGRLAAGAIVPYAAARLPLSGSLLLDQFVDLFVLTHARRKLCSQVDQRLLQDSTLLHRNYDPLSSLLMAADAHHFLSQTHLRVNQRAVLRLPPSSLQRPGFRRRTRTSCKIALVQRVDVGLRWRLKNIVCVTRQFIMQAFLQRYKLTFRLMTATDSRFRLLGSRFRAERELEKEQREAVPGVTESEGH
ncbi:hypothetical protein F7725_014009 [Dissostichus mawsoni]|uniref:Uncharacterized protein n=1 Tax=Dissostichus mawsoni TaxID=36200 RepID=A0A7J5YWY3_DISMA|nr:hypothetical protein F7725_014009 [Dissostichus mawsoni]